MAENAKQPVLVAGFGVGEFGLYISVKNRVSTSKMLRVKAEKNGVVGVAAGFSLEEVKAAYPLGTDLAKEAGATWGAPVLTNGAGEELQNVFKVEGI